MRVSMSAMGSLMLIAYLLTRLADYQLALTTPGISPLKASSRILLRARPNWRNVPRGRPVMPQRLRWRGGVALRGSFFRGRRAAARSSSLFFASFAVGLYFSCRLADFGTRFSR